VTNGYLFKVGGGGFLQFNRHHTTLFRYRFVTLFYKIVIYQWVDWWAVTGSNPVSYVSGNQRVPSNITFSALLE